MIHFTTLVCISSDLAFLFPAGHHVLRALEAGVIIGAKRSYLSGENRKGRRRFKRAGISNLRVISQAKRTEPIV